MQIYHRTYQIIQLFLSFEGDGIGVDITPTMKAVVDAAILKAYGGKRSIEWMEVYCGEKPINLWQLYA